jgi:hypothetical protein
MSDYAQTDWVDNVTPVDAARMDNIEAGIESAHNEAHAAQAAADAAASGLTGKEDKSAKGAANGYAPLGADTKVPAIYLPVTAAGAIEYENAWAVGTAYQPGDVVIHNGVEYLAVNPSTGQTPPTPASAPPLVIPLVTAFPSSPFDGQEVDLTDSLTTPSFVWRCRYVAAAPSNKWKVVGGAPLIAASEVAEQPTGTTSYTDLVNGPTLPIPRPGLYLVMVRGTHTAWTDGVIYLGFTDGVLPASDVTSAESTSQPNPGFNSGVIHESQVALAAGTLKTQARRAAGSQQWTRRRLKLTPVALA